jgi:serine protease Do
MKLAPASGVTIVNVSAGSPADQAGLHAGDVIIQIENQPVQTPTDLESALAGMHAGQQVQIEYDRGPILLTTQVTLRAGPANGP